MRTLERERYEAGMRNAAKDAALEVVATLSEPFSYDDVFWEMLPMLVDLGYGITEARTASSLEARYVVRELERHDLVVRVRCAPQNRPHLFMRA
jgi:hypothetical protein